MGRGSWSTVVGAILVSTVAWSGGLAGCSSSDGGDSAASGAGAGDSSGSDGAGGGALKCFPNEVLIEGACETKCTPEACGADNNTCVGNRCVLKCSTNAECLPDGSQACLPVLEDDTNLLITACVNQGKAPGLGAGCIFGTECEDNGFSACPNGAPCYESQCDGQPEQCVQDLPACRARDAWCTYYEYLCDTEGDADACAKVGGECQTPCLVGRCFGDAAGAPCTLEPQCGANECKAMRCLGNGEGDANAYCAPWDCSASEDCGAGYECLSVRRPEPVCGTEKDCSDEEQACIDPSANQDGLTYAEGPICLMRNVCRKRSDCSPCATDLDCSARGEQRCIFAPDGSRNCGSTCASDGDCSSDMFCDVNQGSCAPRYGACKPVPPVAYPSQFCAPCQTDFDCQDGSDDRIICSNPRGNERACIRLPSGPNTCQSDADCPRAPSGRQGACLDARHQVPETSSLYKSCWYPFDFVRSGFTCW